MMNEVEATNQEDRMPASLVMEKFRKRRLHSGSKGGPLVRSPRQAKAIQINEARSEGKNIPFKKKLYKR